MTILDEPRIAVPGTSGCPEWCTRTEHGQGYHSTDRETTIGNATLRTSTYWLPGGDAEPTTENPVHVAVSVSVEDGWCTRVFFEGPMPDLDSTLALFGKATENLRTVLGGAR